MTTHQLFDAIRAGDLERCRRALDAGISPNAVDGSWSALQTSVQLGAFRAARLLLDRGADAGEPCDGTDGTVGERLERLLQVELFAAIRKGSVERCRALLHDGASASVTFGGLSALALAVEFGRADVARLLIEHGARVDERCDKGQSTLMHVIAKKGAGDMCRLFVLAGAPLDELDQNRLTALFQAAFYGRVEVVKLLLEAGADATLLDNRGNTAFHTAIRGLNKARDSESATEICRLLVQHGLLSSFCPDSPVRGYLTPFQYALSLDHEVIVRVCVEEFGESLDQVARDGRRTADLIEQSSRSGAYIRSLEAARAVTEAVNCDNLDDGFIGMPPRAPRFSPL